MYSVFLWKARYELYPELQENKSYKQVFFHQPNWPQHTSHETRASHSLDFLAGPYESHAFWFEVFECFRRLALSSLLVLFANEEEPATQMVTGVFLSLFSMKITSSQCSCSERRAGKHLK